MPSSPDDGEEVLFNPEGYGRFLVFWDAGTSSWRLGSTGGTFQALPIVKDGGFNFDLFNEMSTTASNPDITINSGVVNFDFVNANTEYNLLTKAELKPKKAEVRVKADFDGNAAIGNNETASIEYTIGETEELNAIKTKHQFDGYNIDLVVKNEERSDTGGFVTNHNVLSCDQTSTHKAAIGYAETEVDYRTYGWTEKADGTRSEKQEIFTKNVAMEFYFRASSDAVADPPSLNLHAIEMRL